MYIYNLNLTTRLLGILYNLPTKLNFKQTLQYHRSCTGVAQIRLGYMRSS